MKIQAHILSFILFLLCIGCASTKQTDALMKDHQGLEEKYLLKDVPFISQSENFCGPASLAMLMSYKGNPIPEEELARMMYTPLIEGTFQADLVSAARRLGMMAIEIPHDVTFLLREVEAGNPVLVLQNLALKVTPQWHYAVVVGYDLNGPDILLHSGNQAFHKMDMRRFEYAWAKASYWGIVVLPPGKLSKTATELAHVTAAVGLENSGNKAAAALAYQSILERWPESLVPLMGLANIEYDKKNFGKAVHYLKLAVKKHPDSALAWHNLAFAQGAQREFEAAKDSSRMAITLVEGKQVELYKLSLREWLK